MTEPNPPGDGAYEQGSFPAGGQSPLGDPNQQQQAPRNGLGIAALVLGIIALVTCWTAIGGIILGIVAIILGIVGYSRAKKKVATNGGMAIAGIITGALGLVIAVIILVIGASFISAMLDTDQGKQLQACTQQAGDNTQAQMKCNQEFLNKNKQNAPNGG